MTFFVIGLNKLSVAALLFPDYDLLESKFKMFKMTRLTALLLSCTMKLLSFYGTISCDRNSKGGVDPFATSNRQREA